MKWTVLLVVNVFVLAVELRRPVGSNGPRWYWIYLFLGCDFTMGAVGQLIVSPRSMQGIELGGIAALWFYLAWRNRPPGGRFRKRILAKVKSMGHRLAVVPA
jgi:hypothetical protein